LVAKSALGSRAVRPLVLTALLGLALASVAAARPQNVAPPAQPGPWRQLGAATSRPGAIVSVARPLLDPHAMAVVATSSSKRPIRGTWYSYCEFDSDDGPTEDHSGTLGGAKRITRYLSVMTDATQCQIQISARVPGKPKARVSVAVFGY
jgi:hypothetical protein